MREDFYRAFEDRFRGSRESVLARLAVYQPFLASLKEAFPEGEALDLGCGRGEWLELLRNSGIKASGVDCDIGMLAPCRDSGLTVVQADALELLKGLPADSQMLVTAFHLVEHLSFEQLQSLVEEAHRVLCPGGLLILETPNADNFLVASHDFYLDPTHKNPVPSRLLAFLCEFTGFARVKTWGLQEDQALHNKENISLRDVLYGASPDYAVVSQKKAAGSVLSNFDRVFALDFGLSTENLLGRYAFRVDQMEESREIRSEIALINLQLADWYAQAVANQAKFNDMLASRSWRITAPLRWVGSQLRRLCREGLKSRLKALVKKIIRKGDRELLRHPRVRQQLICFSRQLRLSCHLKSLLAKSRGTASQSGLSPLAEGVWIDQFGSEINNLTPRAKQIYSDLKMSMSQSAGKR